MESRCFPLGRTSEQAVDQGDLRTFTSQFIVQYTSDIASRFENIRHTHGSSLYSGTSGLLFTFYRITKASKSEASVVTNETGQVLKEYGLQIYGSIVKDIRKFKPEKLKLHDVSFLCGLAGKIVILLVYHLNVLAREESAGDEILEQAKNILGHLCAVACEEEVYAVPDEVLYGRAGLILGLRWLQNEVGDTDFWRNELQVQGNQWNMNIIHAIFRSGSRAASSQPPLLVFSWHNTYYLGAAHGYIGIVHALLVSWGQLSDMEKRLTSELIHWLLSLKQGNGNIPSSLDNLQAPSRSGKEILVHWCHGAPGMCLLLCEAYKVLKDPVFLQSAQEYAEIVWNYGKLKKGWGLCHGAPGNAYCFLSMYQITKQERYLQQARQYALWLASAEAIAVCSRPDEPYGLYTGISGAQCFLLDVCFDPLLATFPLYQPHALVQ